MSDWIEWNYTPEKPYPETLSTRVIVKLRNDWEDFKPMRVGWWHDSEPEYSSWTHGANEPDYEIVAYRVAS